MALPKVPKRRKPDTLSIESFQYPDDLKLGLPLLMLGTEIDYGAFGSDYPPRALRFKPGREWVNLIHQCGGLHCSQRLLVGTVLTSTPAAALGISRLTDKWYASSTGGGSGLPLTTVLDYRDDVRLWLGAEVNDSYSGLEEAFYPIDAEHAGKLATDVLPTDYDDLIEWDDGFSRAMGCIGRWTLAVISQNSD